METLNPKQNETCERCGVVHAQPLSMEQATASALEVLVKAEDEEWRRQVDRMFPANEPGRDGVVYAMPEHQREMLKEQLHNAALIVEGEATQLQLNKLGIDAMSLGMYSTDSLAGDALRITSEQAEKLRERFKMKPHQQDTLDWIKEYWARAETRVAGQMLDELSYHPVLVGGDYYDTLGISGRMMTAVMPREYPASIMTGVSEGIFPERHHGYTRGVSRSKHPQLSQIPKTKEAMRLMRERSGPDAFTGDGQIVEHKLAGDYIPKRKFNPDDSLFVIDSYPTEMMREIERTFEHDPHRTLMISAGQRCGKTRMTGELSENWQRGVRSWAGCPGPAGPSGMVTPTKTPTLKALDDYHYRSARDIYEGEPGRPKGSKAKRKAQKKARKGNRK